MSNSLVKGSRDKPVGPSVYDVPDHKEAAGSCNLNLWMHQAIIV